MFCPQKAVLIANKENCALEKYLFTSFNLPSIVGCLWQAAAGSKVVNSPLV